MQPALFRIELLLTDRIILQGYLRSMKLHSIQFLRAIAVILVVYAYSIELTGQYGRAGQQSFYNLSTIGFTGIDLCFVIAGFITLYTAHTKAGFSAGMTFLQRRFYRINPIYYIASAVFFGITLLQYLLTDKPRLQEATKIISSTLDTLLIVPLGEFTYRPLLIPGWVLSFVWLFQLLFFLTILTRIKRKLVLLTGLIALLTGLYYVLRPHDVRLSFLTNPILLEFLLGAFLCELYFRVQRMPLIIPILLLLTGIAGYLAPVFYSIPPVSNISSIIKGTLSMDRFLYWGVPSACLLGGCVFLEKAGRLAKLWSNKFMVLTGDASFSIYLVHASVFALFAILYHYTKLFLPPDISIFLQLLVALGAGIAFYRWVERPLVKWLNRPGSSSSSRAIGTPASPAQTT